eukprot:scaffold5868_cov120-Isochrysis_galbana.AAC.6
MARADVVRTYERTGVLGAARRKSKVAKNRSKVTKVRVTPPLRRGESLLYLHMHRGGNAPPQTSSSLPRGGG